jgi:hypothetical protein
MNVRRPESGDWSQEAGDRRMEAGYWIKKQNPEPGTQKLETGLSTLVHFRHP